MSSAISFIDLLSLNNLSDYPCQLIPIPQRVLVNWRQRSNERNLHLGFFVQISVKADTRKQLEGMIRTVEDACEKCTSMYELCRHDQEGTNEMARITVLHNQLLYHLHELMEQIDEPFVTGHTGFLQFEKSLSLFLTEVRISRPDVTRGRP